MILADYRKKYVWCLALEIVLQKLDASVWKQMALQMLNLHVVVTKVVRCLHLSWRHFMFSLFLFNKAMLERLKPGMSSVCLSCNSSTCFLLEFGCEGGPIHCLNAMNEVVLPFAKMICYHGSTLSTRPTMDDKQIKHHHHGINISFSWQVSAFSIDVFVVVIVIVIIGNIHPLSMSQPPLCLFGFRHDISVLSIRIQSNVTCYLINDGFAS